MAVLKFCTLKYESLLRQTTIIAEDYKLTRSRNSDFFELYDKLKSKHETSIENEQDLINFAEEIEVNMLVDIIKREAIELMDDNTNSSLKKAWFLLEVAVYKKPDYDEINNLYEVIYEMYMKSNQDLRNHNLPTDIVKQIPYRTDL